MTPGEARLLVARLAAAYPRQQLNQANFDVYCSRLVDLEYAQADAAVNAIIDDREFFPTISEIRKVTAGGIWAIRGMTPEEARNSG